MIPTLCYSLVVKSESNFAEYLAQSLVSASKSVCIAYAAGKLCQECLRCHLLNVLFVSLCQKICVSNRDQWSDELRAGAPLLQGKVEKAGAVQPGEEKAPGRPYCGLSVLEVGL